MIHYDLTQLPPTSSVHKRICFDGDTLRVSGPSYSGVIRIWGIDAPERGQAWFIQSLEALTQHLQNIELLLIPITWDRYNRLIAKLLMHQYEDVGLRMILDGHAWHENLHAPHANDYRSAHVAARTAKIGLWSLPSPHIPPWIFRRKFHQP